MKPETQTGLLTTEGFQAVESMIKSALWWQFRGLIERWVGKTGRQRITDRGPLLDHGKTAKI